MKIYKDYGNGIQHINVVPDNGRHMEATKAKATTQQGRIKNS